MSQPRISVEQPLWRALIGFRVLALVYALAKYAYNAERYAHPAGAWVYMGVLAAWTLLTLPRVSSAARCTRSFLIADLCVALAGILLTPVVDTHARVVGGATTLPSFWAAGPVLAFAIKGGWRWAATASAIVGVSNIVERGRIAAGNVHSIVLLFFISTGIGYVVEVARSSERALARAWQIEAATRERERLARDIHDGVLQVLAMVQRRGNEIGGEAVELGRMAGEQEAALRTLVAGNATRHEVRDAREQAAGLVSRSRGRLAETPNEVRASGTTGHPRSLGAGGVPPAEQGEGESDCGGASPSPPDVAGSRWRGGMDKMARPAGRAPGERGGREDLPQTGPHRGPVDLRTLIRPYAGAKVSVAAPAELVALPPHAARELAAAVAAALDNVTRHAGPGACAWILVEDKPQEVLVSVRDDGPGIRAGRLADAEREGRLGVAQSIRGRLRDLGGTAELTSIPGQGTEVELRIPRGALNGWEGREGADAWRTTR